VVDDDGQVAVPPLIADLVDPDANKSIKGIMCCPSVGHHPIDDRTDGPPGDAHQLTDRRLGLAMRVISKFAHSTAINANLSALVD
jgi:hypothetical protein